MYFCNMSHINLCAQDLLPNHLQEPNHSSDCSKRDLHILIASLINGISKNLKIDHFYRDQIIDHANQNIFENKRKRYL